MLESRIHALDVLGAAQPAAKQAAAFALRDRFDAQLPSANGTWSVPNKPARPLAPPLASPKDMPRRRLGTQAGRGALLHAVAHIEFNAIDLAADMIARFGEHDAIPDNRRAEFILDWAGVCHDEARHFGLIQDRLTQLDMSYGDLPAHDGLWQAAKATADDLMARLAVAPMVLEARGLDVTPAMIAKLKSVGDTDSASILQIIYDDEIGHVAIGRKWFNFMCESQHLSAVETFHSKVKTYYGALLKKPFNEQARDLAGMPRTYYAPLAEP